MNNDFLLDDRISKTGCVGCPFNLRLQKDLDTLAELLPNERAQCEYLWRPVYDEYRRTGYRLRTPEFDDFIRDERGDAE